MHLRGQPVSVTRATKDSGKVFIDGDTTGWPIPPGKDKKSGRPALKVSDWMGVLGNLMFGLPPGGFDTDYAPTFRSLISYFIRRGKDAYSIAFEHYRKQKEWDKQVNNAFLLGLAWEDASEWQKLRDKKVGAGRAEEGTEGGPDLGVDGGVAGRAGSPEGAAGGRRPAGETSLATFRVHEQYHELEETANRAIEGDQVDREPDRRGAAAPRKLSGEPRRHPRAER